MSASLGIWRWVVIAISLWMGFTSIRAYADDEAVNSAKKKKVVYRSHTQIDLSGETVQGKIRAPEVFYIFQRKRSQAHHVVQPPMGFEYHAESIRSTLGEVFA